MSRELIEPPPLPPGLMHLTSEQSSRLAEIAPRRWEDPRRSCLTCRKETTGTSSYRWYLGDSRQPEDVVAYRCRCSDQYLLYQWLVWSGIGLNYMRIDWADTIGSTQNAAQRAFDYALDVDLHISTGTNLIFWSPQPGTGKTFLASLLAKRLLYKGVDVYFSTLSQVADFYTSTWRSEEQRAWFNRRVRGCAVLFVDDLGREHPGRLGVVESMLDTVLRARIADALPTVITTNLQESDLDGYGVNLASLLTENMIKVEVGGDDKRPQMLGRAETERSLKLSRPIAVM